MTGYARVDSVNNIADGNIINASDLDGEFDGVAAAFNASTGHVHDGSAANGAPITKVGPTQDVVVSATTVLPKTSATVDIGSSSLKFKDFFFSGAGSVTGTITAGGFAGPINGTVGATTASTGAFTTLSASSTVSGTGFSTYLASPPAIGGTAAAAGAFTTLSASGTATLSGLTASTALALDASKNIVSVTNTGTGNNVLSASPTLTGTVAGASLSLSSLTSGRVPYATTAGLLTDSANLLYSGTDLTVYGVRVGRGAGAISTNTAAGASALAANTTGSQSTAVGFEALKTTTTSANNTALGAYAGRVYTGTGSVFVGAETGIGATTGNQLTAIGYQALTAGTVTGANDVAVGYRALYNNSSGASNVGIGNEALSANTTGSNNTAQGYQALQANTASNNTAVGYQAAYANTTGASLVAVGYQALDSNTTGSNNTAIGLSALQANTTASGNTAVGTSALAAATGAGNTVIGYQALTSVIGAGQNTAVGYQAGYSLTTSTNGGNSTLIGYQAGYSMSSPATNYAENTFVGFRAGFGVTTGVKNTFIGIGASNTGGAGSGVTTGNNNTIIGAYTGSAAPISATGSNYIVLSDGDGNVRQTINSSGNVGIGTTSPNFQVSFGANIGKTLAVFENAGTSVYGIGMGGAGTGGDPYRTKLFSNGTENASITDAGVFSFNSGYGSNAKAYGCRAWCQYDSSQAIVGSANISSITVIGTGDVVLNFTTAMPDANFAAVATTNESSNAPKWCNTTQPSTTTIRVVTWNANQTKGSFEYNSVAVFR